MECVVLLLIYCVLEEPLKSFKPFKPEFTIAIFIHYKTRIAAAILNL